LTVIKLFEIQNVATHAVFSCLDVMDVSQLKKFLPDTKILWLPVEMNSTLETTPKRIVCIPSFQDSLRGTLALVVTITLEVLVIWIEGDLQTMLLSAAQCVSSQAEKVVRILDVTSSNPNIPPYNNMECDPVLGCTGAIGCATE
jgi:hypothetical protein